MRVLMISRDPTLLEGDAPAMGDAVERHRAYAQRVERLIIFVLMRRRGTERAIAENCIVFPVYISDVLFWWRLRRLMRRAWREQKPDLVIAQDPHAAGLVAWIISRWYQLPIMVNIHGDFFKGSRWQRERALHTLWSWVQWRVLRRAAGIRVVSAELKEKIVAAGIPADKVFVVNTPINDVRFMDAGTVQTAGIEELKQRCSGRRIVLFVGRLVAAKNLVFTLEVIDRVRKRIPEILLLIAGEGELRSELTAAVVRRTLTDNVFFTGPVSHEALPAYYACAEVLLLLSTNESFGKVVVEAGLCQVPSLASATTGARSIITDGYTGFIVPVGDVEATSEVLVEMMENADLTRNMGVLARKQYIARYGFSATVDALISFWKRAASV